MPVAVCTVLNSWRWTERPSETCRVSFQKKNKFDTLVYMVGFTLEIQYPSLNWNFQFIQWHQPHAFRPLNLVKYLISKSFMLFQFAVLRAMSNDICQRSFVTSAAILWPITVTTPGRKCILIRFRQILIFIQILPAVSKVKHTTDKQTRYITLSFY